MASLLGSVGDGPGGFPDPSKHGLVVLISAPFDNFGPCNVGALGRGVEAQGVAARVVLLGTLGPECTERLPVDRDENAVLSGEDLVQIRKSIEEVVVDELNSLEELLVRLSGGGAGNKLVVDVRSHKLTSFIGEGRQSRLGKGVANIGKVEEWAEALGLRVLVTVVEEDGTSNGGLLVNSNDLGNDMGKGVGVESSKVGNGLIVCCQ